MKKNVRHLFSALVVFGFVFMALGSEDEKNSEDKQIQVSSENSNSQVEKMKPEKSIESLRTELKSIENGIDFTVYRKSVESIQMELILFGAWAKIIEDARLSSNKQINELGKELEEKVKNIQKAEFPKLRKAYKEAIYQKLWAENIETEVLGTRNNTIQFTGGIFANNKNKQETQETLSEVLSMFRFKKVNYKWYEYDDEYTFYEMDTPNDQELVKFNK